MSGRVSGTAGWVGGFILLAVWIGVEAGCGFFDIRKPVKPPTGNVECPRQNPDSPANVLFNFEHAVRCKLDGMSQYEESLAPKFTLVLDEIDAQELGTGLTILSRSADIDAHRRLVTDIPDSFYFAFGQERSLELTDTTALYNDIPYQLLYIGTQGDTAAAYRGIAELFLAEGEGARWAITKWIDQRADSTRALGFLHGERAAGP